MINVESQKGYRMKKVIHLLDTKNNKTYCGLKRLSVLVTTSDLEDLCLKNVTCNNCIKVAR